MDVVVGYRPAVDRVTSVCEHWLYSTMYTDRVTILGLHAVQFESSRRRNWYIDKQLLISGRHNNCDGF
jgi:hypothetical protein